MSSARDQLDEWLFPPGKRENVRQPDSSLPIGSCLIRSAGSLPPLSSLSMSSSSLRLLGLSPAFRRSPVFSLRRIQTHSLPPTAAQNILNAQRRNRPSSPHFTIYQPQLTWVGSIANRITGGALSVLLYGFSISYLVLPAFGIPFDSSQLVDLVHGLPEWSKYSTKFLLAAPFAFHSWNGLRHLLWDSGKFLSLRSAYATGYTVLGVSAVTTIGLLLI